MARTKTKITINFAMASRVTQDQIEDAMGAVALDAVGQVKAELSKPGSGKEYSRGKSAVHIASAPGEPPAVDTGRLRNSVVAEVVATRKGAEALIVANTEYAAGLELGTERVRPRPFMRTVMREGVPRWQRILKRFL